MRSDTQDDPNTLAANQAVAFNFRLARESKGRTQDETAMCLDKHLGQRLAAFAEASPESAHEVVETALGFEPGVTMEHCQRVRLDGLIDMVTEELDPVDRNDVPWETLADTDRPEVRDAVLKFAEAIEPELRRYAGDPES